MLWQTMHQILLISWFLSLFVNIDQADDFLSCENLEIKIPVFFDYNNPKKGKSEISVISLMPFDTEKETILVVTDAFSDYADKANYFDSYSPNFNILTIKHRGAYKSFEQKARKEAESDLCNAYTLFSAFQYVNDIESIRSFLLGDKQVLLFGEGSAASLIHQYAAMYGQHLGKFVTLDPIVVDINMAMGYHRSFESFNGLFKEIPETRQVESNAHSDESNGFAQNNQEYINTYREVDFDNLSQKIRLYELALPYLLELGSKVEEPLLEFDILSLVGKIDCPQFTFSGTNYDNLLKFPGKGIIISSAGSVKSDHRVSQILAEYYQHCSLLLVNDSSTISLLKNSNDLSDYLHAFFAGDIDAMVVLYDKLLEAKIIYRGYCC
jgi:pimeloyl-ACP methyl ester carboxylesterase